MRLSRVLAAVGCVLAVVAMPASAEAERARHRDPVGDVGRSPIGSNAYAPAPTMLQGDVVSVRVVHAPRTIWIRVRYRELTTTTNGNFHLIGIRSDRRDRSIELDALPGHWTGRAVTTNPRGRTVGCALRYAIDYDRNQVRVAVPRACLGGPSWVRVGVRTTIAGTAYAYVDDARATGYRTTLAYGPRVRH